MWVVCGLLLGLNVDVGTTKDSEDEGFGRPCVNTSCNFELTIVAVDEAVCVFGGGIVVLGLRLLKVRKAIFIKES